MDRRDTPLRWVVNSKGNAYSLDQGLEEAMLYLQQYCWRLIKLIKLLELSDWERLLLDINVSQVNRLQDVPRLLVVGSTIGHYISNIENVVFQPI
jgi:hypothetical protein